jgi:hypothetical protein
MVSCWSWGTRIEADYHDGGGLHRKSYARLVIGRGTIEPHAGNESWYSQCCCERNDQSAGVRLGRFRAHSEGPGGLYCVPWDRMEF